MESEPSTWNYKTLLEVEVWVPLSPDPSSIRSWLLLHLKAIFTPIPQIPSITWTYICTPLDYRFSKIWNPPSKEVLLTPL